MDTISLIGRYVIYGIQIKKNNLKHIYYGQIIDKVRYNNIDRYMINNDHTEKIDMVDPSNIFMEHEERFIGSLYYNENDQYNVSYGTIDCIISSILGKKIDYKELEYYQGDNGLLYWRENGDEIDYLDVKNIYKELVNKNKS